MWDDELRELVKKLAEQQAMEDKWWEKELEEVIKEIEIAIKEEFWSGYDDGREDEL